MFKKFWKRKDMQKWTGICVSVLVVLGLLTYYVSFRAPSNFPNNSVVTISNGQSLTAIARELEQNHVIRSPFWFTNLVILFKQEKGVVNGTYYFNKPLNVLQVASVLSAGDYNMQQVRTTIPEGSTIFDISQIIKKNYPAFDDIHFLTLAQQKEGYLFPDTYTFGANPTPEQVVSIMTNNFNQKIKAQDIQNALATSTRSLNDIVTMASILEGEARQTSTRQIVAGILWKRIDQGIPLQVDSGFRYVDGKTTDELTLDDLKIDSPYNTYLYKGLPPTPISNPGLDSIRAALNPTATNYMYFLTDKKGNMHYAKTLEQHAENKAIYLQ